MSIGYLLYKLSTRSYFKFIQLIAPFHERAGKLYYGQKTPIQIAAKEKNEKRLWIHVASLGEFEQAKPVLLELKRCLPNLNIIVSFFSPSGYENRKNETIIDYAIYLPFESKKQAKLVLDHINPDIVIWVKYDFWVDYLSEIFLRKIPVYLIAALFRSQQHYFKFPGNFHLTLFEQFTQIFTQNNSSSALLAKYNIKSICTGDPRFDNVYQLKSAHEHFPLLNSFWNQIPVIVCGSTYAVEENIIQKFQQTTSEHFKYIIAPHFVDKQHIKELKRIFPDAIVYSSIDNKQDLSGIQTVIIDNIGILPHLYHKASIAIIGGGFKKGGLHNILEASIHGIPVLIGPKINRFPEALELIANNSAFIFKDANSLLSLIEKIYPSNLGSIKEKTVKYMDNHLGTCKMIADSILYDLKQ
jgi:3-deoxy-D-manno-octulosonic-acid transferase